MTGINNNPPGFGGANFNPGQAGKNKNDATVQPAASGEAVPPLAPPGQEVSAERIFDLMSQQSRFGNGITAAGLSVAQSVHSFEKRFSPTLFAALEETVRAETSDFGLSDDAQDLLVGETLANLTAGAPSVSP